VQPTSAVQAQGDAEPTDQGDGEAKPSGGITAAAQVRRASGLVANRRGGSEDRSARAAAYARQLDDLQPGVGAQPAVRFPLAAAVRGSGQPRPAERFYLGVRQTRAHDTWWTCAQGEFWLAEPKGLPPKSIWNCAPGGVKPRLDGRLDDPIWRAARPVELHSPQRDDAEWLAVAMLSYDAEFLYFAVSCQKAPGLKYEKSSGPRPRDADLAQHDRVELLIDLDRDWTTYYALSVDSRGHTADACWHDTTWNPTWYVATQMDEKGWTAEAAIPLSQLTGQFPSAKQVWSVGVQRVVPGAGFQSWTSPASTDVVPEGFGYLIFE
jgi:hypothetical protein